MRNPSDLPPAQPRRRLGDRGRTLFIVAAVVVVGLLLSARFLAGFYVDFLWHRSVGRTDVFWGVLGAKATMFALFGVAFAVLAVLNLIIADRLAPATFSANTHPAVQRFHEFFGHRLRGLRLAVAGVLAIMFALPTVGRWQDWMMFRHSTSFGIKDPRFGNDVGFYLFELPFVAFVLDWLFIAVAMIILLVVATHVLSGGIVLQPPRPKVRRATKAHIAVLLAVLAVIKAGDYWVTRYELTTANRGLVRGATYAVDNAQLPAVLLLALVALLTAVLFLVSLKTGSWRPAVVVSVLWVVVALVGGVVYPAVVQGLVVNPNQRDKEARYIAYNIAATRHALGIDHVDVLPMSFESITTSEVASDVSALADVRLIKPSTAMQIRFQTDEGRPGTAINDLDADRYTVDGAVRQVIIGARELDLGQVGNKSWQGTHLINTHGCGLVVSPAGRINDDRTPAYDDAIAEVTRPELYFDTSLSGYAVLDTSVGESSCDGGKAEAYHGDGGVQLNSFVRRLAFALDELDYNLVGSSAIGDSSRLVSVRNVRDRVSKIAPFLSLDGDPYPVAIGGRVKWVIDGYTTSSRYPYGQVADRSQLSQHSGIDASFNYIRNSVKAVVDAYDGSIVLYAIDTEDPILRVWSAAFPDLLTPMDAMPAELQAHLRYPEDLFRIQTAAYSKYRLDADSFYDRDGAWSVAQAAPEQSRNTVAATTDTADAASSVEVDAGASQFASDSGAVRFEPYFAMFHGTGDSASSFQMYRPFQPFSATDQRKELAAYMTVGSDPGDYGRLVAHVLPTGTKQDGPFTVGSAMVAFPEVTSLISLADQRGSQVSFGDLQMLPVSKGVVWFRPLYVESENSGQPLVQKMIVNYGGDVAMGDSFGDALGQLFRGLKVDIGDVSGASTTPDTGGTTTGTTGDETPAALLRQADDLFAAAEKALKDDGDLGTYQEKIKAAQDLVKRALDQLSQAG